MIYYFFEDVTPLVKEVASALFKSYMGSKETIASVEANGISYYYALDDSMGRRGKNAKMKDCDDLEKKQALSS